jgi:hypothetical protein
LFRISFTIRACRHDARLLGRLCTLIGPVRRGALDSVCGVGLAISVAAWAAAMRFCCAASERAVSRRSCSRRILSARTRSSFCERTRSAREASENLS